MNRVLASAGLGIALSISSQALAADYFLKLEGLPGESKREGHKDWIELESWSFGTSNAGSLSAGAGGGSGRTAMAEPTPGSAGSLTLVRPAAKATPQLYLACAKGKHIPSAKLERCASGACQRYELRDVLISSVSVSNTGSGAPLEQISINYQKIEIPAASAERESPSRPSMGTASPRTPQSP